MNEQLLKFIALCLTDGVITDKEREVIFRKAAEYNVDIDECEIILESMIQQKNMSQTSTVSKNEIATDVNTEINNSERDSLFREAAELIVEYQEVSEDFLKDKLKLETNRACRLIKQLETTGLINKINGNNEYKINIRNGVFLDHFLTSGEIKKIYDYSFTNLTLLEKSKGARIPNINEDGYKYNLNLGDRTVEMSLEDEESIDCFFIPNVGIGFKGIEEFFKETKPKDDYIQFFEKLFAFGTSYKKIKKYPNGDFFLGKIVDEKANGFGELTITSDEIFSHKKTKYIGHFFNDTFLEGKIICYESDEVKNINLENNNNYTEYSNVRLLNNKYLCSCITYPNGDDFEGTVIDFKEHGRGKMQKSNGDILIGTWQNGTCVEYSSLKEFRNTIYSFTHDNKHLECINEAKNAELLFKDLFKDSATALEYLWSLKEVDLEKAYEEIDRITKIVEDKSKLQNVIGLIYQRKGTKTNDLTLLNKALHCFQSHNYNNKELGEERIFNVQLLINKITLDKFNSSNNVNKESINNNENYTIINEFKNSIKQLYSEDKYQEVINEAELAEIVYEDLFEDSFIAAKYLWSLMVRDLEKAYEEIDRIAKITSDKTKIQDAVGMIYAKKGDKNNDLNLLKKALQSFQSYDYSDKEFGTKRLNYVQNLLIQNKLKALGLNHKLEEGFKNGNHTKLWKVNCYLSEPTYLKGNLKIEQWRDSNVNFYVPSNGILNEKNAIAFIKANWNNYKDFICDKSWRSKGYKFDSYSLVDFDKRKIEIIEINEIVFN
ncbi:DNA translocase FtsK [Flavobacterium sp.]|jgi:ribosomal protein S25|uniref:DNA translocase FtsK n=1 Tax=Flavobacterium sp. TaxID=239 RepID=UPI00378480E9